jgi:hypothetical protein
VLLFVSLVELCAHAHQAEVRVILDDLRVEQTVLFDDEHPVITHSTVRIRRREVGVRTTIQPVQVREREDGPTSLGYTLTIVRVDGGTERVLAEPTMVLGEHLQGEFLAGGWHDAVEGAAQDPRAESFRGVHLVLNRQE